MNNLKVSDASRSRRVGAIVPAKCWAEAPRTKRQAPEKLQTSSANRANASPSAARHVDTARPAVWTLELEVSLEFGAWDLERRLQFANPICYDGNHYLSSDKEDWLNSSCYEPLAKLLSRSWIQIRSPMTEIRTKPEIRNLKPAAVGPPGAFRRSGFGFLSDFGLRISGFASASYDQPIFDPYLFATLAA